MSSCGFLCEGNPLRFHRTLSDGLVFFQGVIEPMIEDGGKVRMKPRDSINIPVDLPHRARDGSSEDAILMIAFSLADGETVKS